MKRLIYIVLVLIFLTGCSRKKDSQVEFDNLITPIERSEFTKLTTHREIMEYLSRVDSLSDLISVESAGKSIEGKDIPLVKIIDQEEKSEDKIDVFLFAQQHGDEPSGKEGMLLLINEIAKGLHNKWFEKINLYIMPQVNPDGGDRNKRRNANGTDLNRDHLLLREPETRAVHSVFEKFQPEVTVDVHEYGAYSDYWKEFGYRRDFDIQLGSLTNLNVDKRIKNLFYEDIKPFVRERVTGAGYSFFEYTLGDFPGGGRLRHSTVDVNDGRQSMGILNTVSFIVEGKYGRDSVHLLERRAKSQKVTAESLIQFAAENTEKINELVDSARDQLKNAEKGEKVAVRMHHVKGEEPLKYPLKSLKTGKDTVFVVEEFHSRIISLLDIEKPMGYLIPRDDKNLSAWLERSFIQYSDYMPEDNHSVKQYAILNLKRSVDEGLENYYPDLKIRDYDKEIKPGEYYFVPIGQLRSSKIVTALEPQSMLGIVNYPEFEYLVREKDTYSVLRVHSAK